MTDSLRIHVHTCPFALDKTFYQDCPRDVHGIEADRCPACPKRPEWRDPFDETEVPAEDVRRFDRPGWVAGVLFSLVIVISYIVIVL